MMTRLLTISAVVLAFCACGPGAKISGGKQGAAQALYAASTVTRGGTPSGSGIDIGASIDVKCPQGGSATLKGFGLSTNFGGGSTAIGESFTAVYNNCGFQTNLGNSVLQGSLSVDQKILVDGSSTNVDQTLKGKLLWGGATDDFLDIDITQQVGVTALNQTGGGVAMVLKGSVADSEGTYTYDESVSVTPGNISVEIAADKK